MDDDEYQEILFGEIDENHETVIEECITTEMSEENIEDGRDYKNIVNKCTKIQKIMDLFKIILEEANTEEQLDFKESSVEIMYHTVKDLASNADQPVQVSYY